jgi:hypothetical protein
MMIVVLMINGNKLDDNNHRREGTNSLFKCWEMEIILSHSGIHVYIHTYTDRYIHIYIQPRSSRHNYSLFIFTISSNSKITPFTFDSLLFHLWSTNSGSRLSSLTIDTHSPKHTLPVEVFFLASTTFSMMNSSSSLV